jgi:hypothetical protein
MWVYHNGRLKINMARYLILRTRFFEIFLHQFFASDERVYHDHPWWFCSFVITGTYVEETLSGGISERRRGAVRFYSSSHRHRVIVPTAQSGFVWSLVIAGRRRGRWNFFDRTTGEAMTPHGYGERRGITLRVDADFGVKGVFFPRLCHGTKSPEIYEIDNAARKSVSD